MAAPRRRRSLTRVRQTTRPLARSWVGSYPTVYARRLDGIDDELRFPVTTATNLTGALTMAAVIRRRDEVDPAIVLGNHTSAGGATNARLGLNVSGQVTLATSAGSTFVKTNQWVIIVARKDAGTVTPTLSVYQDGAWTHDAGSIAVANSASQASGTIRVGSFGGIAWYRFDIAVGGEWGVLFSQAQVEELSTNFQTQDWYADTGGTPGGLWQFNQTSISTAIRDLTNNGGTETSPGTTGTEVIQAGPRRNGVAWEYLETTFPDQLTHTRAIYDPTVSVSVSITPAQLTHTRDIYTPRVDPKLFPAQLTQTRAIYSPTVHVKVFTDFLTHNRDIYGPTATTGATVTPDLLTHTRAIYSPTLNVALTGAFLSHTRAIYDATVSPTLKPGLLTHTRDFYTPGIGGGIKPDLLTHTRAIHAPTVSPTVKPDQLTHARAIYAPVSSVTVPVGFLTHDRAIYSPTIPDGEIVGWDFILQREIRPLLEGDF